MWVLPQRLSHLKLRKIYLTAIISLMLMVVLMQLFSTQILRAHRENAELLEMIGKQKLLSQQMVKLALVIERKQHPLEKELHQMAVLSDEWSQVHFHLKFGNDHRAIEPPSSEKIDELIRRLQPHKDRISDAVKELLMVVHVNELRAEAVDKIRMHEEPFLLSMDELAIAYGQEKNANASWLGYLKFLMFLCTMVGLVILLLLYPKIQMSDDVYSNPWLLDKKGFFNEAVADEFIMSQTSDKQQNMEEKSQKHDFSVHSQASLPNLHQKISVIVIADPGLPNDYIAWFLNKWEIDFTIVKSHHLAQIELQSDTFDMVLMSQEQAHEYKGEYLYTKEGNTFKVPILPLDASDIKEIQEQIHEEKPPKAEFRSLTAGNLYRKIEMLLPKEKWRV